MDFGPLETEQWSELIAVLIDIQAKCMHAKEQTSGLLVLNFEKLKQSSYSSPQGFSLRSSTKKKARRLTLIPYISSSCARSM